MSISIQLSPGLQSLCAGQNEIRLEASTVREAIHQLTSRFSALTQRLFREEGKRNMFVNVYVNNEDIRYLEDLDTPLKEGDRIDIFAGVSGG